MGRQEKLFRLEYSTSAAHPDGESIILRSALLLRRIERSEQSTARESLASLDRLLAQLSALFGHEGIPADDPGSTACRVGFRGLQIEALNLAARATAIGSRNGGAGGS